MNPGLFGDAKLEYLHIMGNPDMLNFDAAALFPGSSGQQLGMSHLENCGLTGIGGESSTNFHGLLGLVQLYLQENKFGDGIAEDAFDGLTKLTHIELNETGLTSLPSQVFTGECCMSRWGITTLLTRPSPGLKQLRKLHLSDNDLAALPQGLFAELCSITWLSFQDVESTALDNDTFAGFPLCETIRFNHDAKEMCEAQQHVFVEGSCFDQACQAGECSSCYSESSCGSSSWCSWGLGDDGAAGSCAVSPCEEGKEPNGAELEERSCDPCEAGKYSAVVSYDACTRCVAGRFSEAVGSVSADDCVECEAGKASGSGSDACGACEAGKYSTVAGSDACSR
jgi:hypothetical protein